VSGEATVGLGGPVNGDRFELQAGDVAILPAGTGHKCLKASRDFLVVGAYPPGQDPDLRRDTPTTEMIARIATLPFPKSDPVMGAGGPLLFFWKSA
jgi:uncharacterized protein YjlB